MTVELSLKQCELLGVLSHQPYVGFELIRCDGVVAYSTQSARQLMYADVNYDPTDKPLIDIDGRMVGAERHGWVQNVCNHQAPMRFEFVRMGRLMTNSMWPIRSLPTTPDNEADAVLTMVTYAVSPSRLLLTESFAPTNPLLREGSTRSLELAGTSRFASWGKLGLLTVREREVLVLIGEGLSQKDIGERLAVSTKTVETHRMRLGKKLDVVTGSELVRLACRSGIGLEHAALRDHADADWMKDRPDLFPQTSAEEE